MEIKTSTLVLKKGVSSMTLDLKSQQLLLIPQKSRRLFGESPKLMTTILKKD
jgi:hypothetical protein